MDDYPWGTQCEGEETRGARGRDRHLVDLGTRTAHLIEYLNIARPREATPHLRRLCAQCIDAIEAARRLQFSWSLIGQLDDKVGELESEVRAPVEVTVADGRGGGAPHPG